VAVDPGTHAVFVVSRDANEMNVIVPMMRPVWQTAPDLGQATVNTPFHMTLVATPNFGDHEITYNRGNIRDGLNGLPPGLAVDPRGVLAGTPTQAGTFTFDVVAYGDQRQHNRGPRSTFHSDSARRFTLTVLAPVQGGQVGGVGGVGGGGGGGTAPPPGPSGGPDDGDPPKDGPSAPVLVVSRKRAFDKSSWAVGPVVDGSLRWSTLLPAGAPDGGSDVETVFYDVTNKGLSGDDVASGVGFTFGLPADVRLGDVFVWRPAFDTGDYSRSMQRVGLTCQPAQARSQECDLDGDAIVPPTTPDQTGLVLEVSFVVSKHPYGCMEPRGCTGWSSAGEVTVNTTDAEQDVTTTHPDAAIKVARVGLDTDEATNPQKWQLVVQDSKNVVDAAGYPQDADSGTSLDVWSPEAPVPDDQEVVLRPGMNAWGSDYVQLQMPVPGHVDRLGRAPEGGCALRVSTAPTGSSYKSAFLSWRIGNLSSRMGTTARTPCGPTSTAATRRPIV
jgi:hypothetical protein